MARYRTYGRPMAGSVGCGVLWLLSALERDLAPGVLLMDGIFVADAATRPRDRDATFVGDQGRGAGAGGVSVVRLDVIDSNPRARALYEREGFCGWQADRAWAFGALSSGFVMRPR